mgnify:CR=1 FL=1
MKKIVLLMIAVAACLGAAAQDVIILTNGDEIEAKVLKVTETVLEYKRYDNPDGPSYVKLLTNVFMVKYENGVKDVFTTPETVARQTDATVRQDDVVEMGEHSPLTLRREGGSIVSNVGSLNNKDMKRLLGDAAYDGYTSAKRGYDVGNTLKAFGIAVGVLGAMAYIGAVGSALDSDGGVAAGLYVIGSIAIVAHSIMTPVGFVRRGIAAGQISRIAEDYNRYNKCTELSLVAGPASVGLVLSF